MATGEEAAGRANGQAGAPAIVLYDGRCGFCRRQAGWLRRRMRPGALRLVDAGSPEGLALLEPRGLVAASRSSLVVLGGAASGAALLRSAAALAVARRLRWPWRALGAARALPRPWLDRAYDAVARRRQRDEACDWHAPDQVR